ncbi:MAG: methylmalonyl-CoA mutase family protein [Saprospiraceae bacterium]
MITWNEFKKPTKSEWTDKVERDLKGKKSIHELAYQVEKGWTIDPFLTHEDGLSSEIILGSKPLSCVEITGMTEVELNKKAKQMLQLGAAALILNIEPEYDLKMLFSEIYLDMITVILKVNGSGNAFEQKLKIFLADQYPSQNIAIRILDDATHVIRLSYQMSFQDRIQTFAKAIKNISGNHQIQMVEVELKKDFLAQISELRALRLLWAESTQKHIKLHIITSIHPEVFADTDIHPLIVCNYLLMSAYMGMSDIVSGIPYGDDEEMARLCLNIHHIFHEEAHLDAVSDPAAGAYMIEKMTFDLVNFGK